MRMEKMEIFLDTLSNIYKVLLQMYYYDPSYK